MATYNDILNKLKSSELLSSTKSVIDFVGRFGRTILQETAKSGASLGLTLTAPFTGVRQISSEELPEDQRKFKEFVFGQDPIKAIETRIAETEITLQRKGIEIPLIGEDFQAKQVVKPEELKGLEFPLAFIGVGLTVGLDFVGGGGKKQVVSILSKTNKIDDVAKILKKINVADDLIPTYAKTISKLNKTDDVAKALDKIIDIQKTTKVTGEIGEAAKKVSPLIEEAKKYKSADEFVRMQPLAYHGSPVPLKRFSNKKGGVFFTDNYADATGFAGDPDNVYEGYLNFKKPLVIDAKGAKWDELNTKYGKSTQEVVSNAQGKGFDGVVFKNVVDNIGDTADFGGQGTIYYAYKPQSSFINESQLTDIYNKAQEVKKVVSKAPKLKERRFLQSVSRAEPNIPLKVGGQYVPRSTDDLSIKASNLIKDNIEAAEKLARTGTDENAVATASELIKHYSSEATKFTNRAIKNTLYDKASEIAHITAKNLTEQGRAVQAASIVGRLTPEGMLRFAAKEINKYNDLVEKASGLFGLRKKIPQLSNRQTEHILSEFKRIEKMPDGLQKAMSFKELNDSISKLIPSSMYQKIINVWKAGLLTGIKTSGLNTMSNLFHGVSETIKDVPGVVVDSVASLITGRRTLALTTKGTVTGFKEGFEKGIRYLQTGFDERNVATKLDWRKVNFGDSKFAKGIQKYEETVFQLMGAQDQPFYYGAKAKSLMSQAIAQAKNKGLKGSKAKEFIEGIIKSPTDEMLKYATTDAEIAVFQNPTVLGRIARAVQKAPGGEFVVPFGRTPSAVANQLINYSPVGIVKAIVSNIGKGKFDQRLFSQAIGRGITGTGIMHIGGELFKKNLINLNYPVGEKEQKLWEIEGRKPNSIKVGGKWRDVNVLGPAGMVLIVGAGYQKSLEENGSVIRALADSMAAGTKALTEQTFLRGINQVIEALNNPDRFFEGYFAGTIASVIPTLVSDVAKAFDPLERRTIGVLDRLKARVPGVRQTLEPRIDVLGREKQRGGNWLETMIDPSRPVRIISEDVSKELRRLTDLGFKVSPTLLGDREGYKELSPEENTSLWEKAGELTNSKLNSLINLEQYKKLIDEDKSKLVEDVINKSKTIARAQAVMDLTEGLSGEEFKNKLKELKEGRLMTREVFELFLQFRE